ncbi:MAG: hypothetical protein IJ704_00445 [Bacilli bacterium]|nr:hypothetical protein [Bacilli bacterium]
MEYNIIAIYTKYIKEQLLALLKLVLKKDYNNSLCKKLVNRYIEVRYYNETNYAKDKDFVIRLNKDLLEIYEEEVNAENEEMLKNAVAMFAYILSLDDLYDGREDMEILSMLNTDENLKIERDQDLKKNLRKWYFNFKKGKEKFFNTLFTKEFSISEKRVYKKTSEPRLEHNVKISNLYSELAISKAYQSGIVAEDKLFITSILVSKSILENAIALDFTKKYIIPIEKSLFLKKKKFNRFMASLDNPLSKKLISLKIEASDYLKNKEWIQEKMKDGFSFAIVLNTEVPESEFILFSYLYVFEESELFDIIMNSKDQIPSKIIII